MVELKKYEIPTNEEMDKRAENLEILWKEFLKLEGEEDLEYHIHKKNLFEVIKRQDKRMHYLRIFHDLDCPCEYKYIAIECFWINTLKPFIVTDEKSKVYNCPNEMFSLYLIIVTIRAIYEIYVKDKKFEYPTKERMHDILYDFKFCSLSREAMIAFVETFADNYGIGIDFLQKNAKDISRIIKSGNIAALWGEVE